MLLASESRPPFSTVDRTGRRPTGLIAVAVVCNLVAAVCALAFAGRGGASASPARPSPRALLALTASADPTAATSLGLFRGTLRVRWPVVTTTTGAPSSAPPAAPIASRGLPAPSDAGYTLAYPDGSGGSAAWWNPCDPIRFAVNLSDAPTGALDDALAAVAVASQATGLTFDYVGTTGFSPDPAGGWGQMPAGVDAVIGWVSPAQLGGGRGEAGAGGSWWRAAGSHDRIDEGYALINGDIAKAILRPGSGTGYSEAHLLLHELGHMLGLAHTADPGEVMYPQTGPLSPSAYGPGDLAGLRYLGSQPCV